MTVNPVKLGPDDAQKLGARRHFDAHYFLDSLTVAHGMYHRTDATDPFDDLNHLVKVAKAGEDFKAPVNKTKGRNRFDDDLILDGEFQMQRFRQNRVLRAEWYDGF
jgi:hypothetical protein